MTTIQTEQDLLDLIDQAKPDKDGIRTISDIYVEGVTVKKQQFTKIRFEEFEFKDCKFEGCSFFSCTFEKCSFEEAIFVSAQFKGVNRFMNNSDIGMVFKTATYFSRTIIQENSDVVFSCVFDKTLEFNYTTIKSGGTLKFENTTFTGESSRHYFKINSIEREYNDKTGALRFERCFVQTPIQIVESNLEKLDFDSFTLNSSIDKILIDEGTQKKDSTSIYEPIDDESKRIFYNILKYHAEKRHDKINALRYYAKEMDAYLKVKLGGGKKKNNKKEKINDPHRKQTKVGKIVIGTFFAEVLLEAIGWALIIMIPYMEPSWRLATLIVIFMILIAMRTSDNFLLILNRWSNNFGTSWLRALRFLAIGSFCFFNAMNTSQSEDNKLFLWGWEGLDSFLKVLGMYLKMLNPLNVLKSKEIFSQPLSPASHIIFFCSQIFVAFGIYQLITAFRKFRR